MYIYVYFIIIVLLYYIFMYSNNLEGRQGSDLIQYSTPWEYELTNKQTNCNLYSIYSSFCEDIHNRAIIKISVI